MAHRTFTCVRRGAVVVIDLPDGDRPLGIRALRRMRPVDVVAAVRLVEANAEMLVEQWRKYHGEAPPE